MSVRELAETTAVFYFNDEDTIITEWHKSDTHKNEKKNAILS